mgnify:CR=1 FL=1
MGVRYLFPPEAVFPVSGMCPSKQEYAAFKTFLERELAGFEADVAINNYGEAVQNQPGEIASMIAGGTVWVDYCGWPMYYLLVGWPVPPEGVPLYEIGRQRFGDFLRAVGKPLTFRPGPGAQWEYPVFDPLNSLTYVFYFINQEYPWVRGLMTDVDITTKGFVTPPKGADFPSASKVVTEPVSGQKAWIYCYSCFGFKYGKGWYFYAWRGKSGALTTEGVLPANYARFVAQTLKTAAQPEPQPQPQPQPPGLEHRAPVRLQEQPHHQQRLGNPALAAHHLGELLRQDRNRKPLRIHALLDGPLLERIHDVGDADLPRAFHRAGVTGGAQPHRAAAEHLVLEVRPHQRHHLPRREIHVDAQRARTGTGPALDAAFELLAARDAHDLLGETPDAVGLVFDRALDLHHRPACARR